MRKKKNTDKRLGVCSEYILPEAPITSDKNTVLEIGCGKGSFICELAKRQPDTFFVAMEKVPDVAMLAAEAAMREGLENVRFIIADAKNLGIYFPETKVSRIYLNFSDPWTRSGYYKRRLTYRAFLEIYKSILTPDGAIFFKTDNRDLFDFSLNEFCFSGFDTRCVTYDLHNSEYAADNIMTEYEKNFSSKGFPIHRVEAYLTPASFIKFEKAASCRIDSIMPLFDSARLYMAEHNIPQWQDGYPQRELIENDVENGNGYVLLHKGRVVGYSTLFFGNDLTYSYIENGKWRNDRPYVTMHRVAVADDCKGMGLMGKFVSSFADMAKAQGIFDLRGDTHEINRSMRRAFEKNGFEYCGVIYLENGEPRVAYHKIIEH